MCEDSLLKILSRLACFFQRRERADVDAFPIVFDLRVPSAIWQKVNAFSASGVVLTEALVFLVLLARHATKILNPVVGRFPVDVVKHHRRPNAMRIEPSKTMGEKRVPIYPNDKISALSLRACWSSRMRPSVLSATAVNEPEERTRNGVVGKKFLETIEGKIGFSHGEFLSLVGQRPGSIASAIPASSF